MGIFDTKQQSVNEYVAEKFNKESTYFLNSMESIAQNLFNISNNLIKEYGYLSNFVHNNEYNSYKTDSKSRIENILTINSKNFTEQIKNR